MVLERYIGERRPGLPLKRQKEPHHGDRDVVRETPTPDGGDQAEKPTTKAYREVPYKSLWWVFLDDVRGPTQRLQRANAELHQPAPAASRWFA